jgi:hypothetical protein
MFMLEHATGMVSYASHAIECHHLSIVPSA